MTPIATTPGWTGMDPGKLIGLYFPKYGLWLISRSIWTSEIFSNFRSEQTTEKYRVLYFAIERLLIYAVLKRTQVKKKSEFAEKLAKTNKDQDTNLPKIKVLDKWQMYPANWALALLYSILTLYRILAAFSIRNQRGSTSYWGHYLASQFLAKGHFKHIGLKYIYYGTMDNCEA